MAEDFQKGYIGIRRLKTQINKWRHGLQNRWLEKLENLGNKIIEAFGEKKITQPEGNSEYAREATWSDVETVTSLLAKEGAEFILVGGYAMSANGLGRVTSDIDILINQTPENQPKWINALSKLPDGEAEIFKREEDPFYGDDTYAIRLIDEFVVDIMPSVHGLRYKDLKPHSKEIIMQGEVVLVLNLVGLEKTKQGSLRGKDQTDYAMIKQALRIVSQTYPE